jgi:O-antigen/teichoic acid export membrane protein
MQSEQAARVPALSAALAGLKAWLTDGSDQSLAQRLAGAVFLIRVVSAVLAYIAQVLLARWMGSHEFGIYVYVWTWVLLIGGVVDLGLASSAQRFVPEYAENKSLLRGFLTGGRWLATGIATAFAVLAAAGVKLLEPWLDNQTVIPLYLACVTLPMYALTHIQDGIARSYNWVHLALWPQYILRQLAIIGLMAAAYFAGLPMDAATAMIAAVVAVWATTVGQLLMLNRRLHQTVVAGPKAYAIKTWFATSIPILLVEGFYLLLTYVDIIILQQFRPSDEVAVYYAAAKTLSLVAFIYFSVSATTAHKFTEYHVAGDRERLASFLTQSIKWTFWPSLVATVVVLACGRPLLWLFGESFVDGYYLMFVLAIGLLARSAIGPVERLLNMLGEQRVCAMVYAAAFALNLILCFVLIPHYGAAGAAIATSVALVGESILLFFVTKRRLGFHVFVFGRPSKR